MASLQIKLVKSNGTLQTLIHDTVWGECLMRMEQDITQTGSLFTWTRCAQLANTYHMQPYLPEHVAAPICKKLLFKGTRI